MIVLQSATKVPDPQSIPENAPEHCPVSSKPPSHVFYLEHVLLVRRERIRNSQENQTHVRAAIIEKYVLRAQQNFQILPYPLSGSVC